MRQSDHLTSPRPPLPAVVPVLPVAGLVLLPGNRLPLRLAEGYDELVAAAFGQGRWLGMIQPLVDTENGEPEAQATPLQGPLLDGPDDGGAIEATGCLGRIDYHGTRPEGGHVLVLTGVSRFRVVRELPPRTSVRRALVDYDAFAADLEPKPFDSSRLVAMLQQMDGAVGGIDVEGLAKMPGLTLLNQLSALLPLPPVEKQALLEAPGPREREDALLALLEMGMASRAGGKWGASSSVVN